MKKFKTVGKAMLVAGALMLPIQQGMAAEGEFYIAPGLQWLDFDSDRAARNDHSFNFGIGYGLTENWDAEINYGKFNLNSSTMNDDMEHYRLDFIHEFDNKIGNNLLTPFLITGIGHNSFKNDDETFLGAGLGVKYEITDNVSWRTAVRGIHGLDDSTTDGSLEMALVLSFGSSEPRSRVEPTPAPTPAPVTNTVVDSDGDGVPDNRDDCPNTPRNHQVDARGCSIMLEEVERIELNVQFDFDRSEVKDQYLADIRRVADFLRTYTDTVANLEGHTDSVGTDEYNQNLSERRVTAVRQVLVQEFGIEPGRITVTGYGEARPVATNDTAAGRAQNRRVESAITATLQRPQTR